MNQVEIDGETFPLPDNTILGYPANFYQNYSETSICNSLTMEYVELTENSFYLTGFTATLMECPDQPGVDDFEAKYASLFWFQENTTFQYEITTDPEWSHIHQLIITNPEGNKAYYGNDALNTAENNLTSFNVYPNPFHEKLGIENPHLKFDEIKIIDANGKLVLSKKINSQKIELDLSSFSNGIYFIQFISDHRILKTEKIIKK